MMRKFVTGALALSMVVGTLAVTTETASARYGRNGAFVGGAVAGLVGGALLGGALNQGYAAQPQYYYEPEPQPVYVPRCYYQNRRIRNTYDYGYHIERVRVCDQGGY
jgi:hypothetical protein